MKFTVDTNDFENIKLDIAEEELDSPEKLIEDFCFAAAGFYIDLTRKIGASPEQIRSFDKVCAPFINSLIEQAVEDGLYN